MSRAEKKVVVNVQFEFYPEGHESFRDKKMSNKQLVEAVEQKLDMELMNTDNDGLWWHFEKSEVVVNA